MELKKNGLYRSLIVFLIFSMNLAFAKDIFDSTKIRGFGSIGGSYNNNDKTEYRDSLLTKKYSSDNFSFATDSKLGLQIDTDIDEKLSFTLQGLIRQLDHTGIDTSFEWVNLKYTFDDLLNLKIGRMRTPLFLYSDVINVSYAYPWLRLPNEVYSSIPTTGFNGIELDKVISLDSYIINTTFLYGNESEKIYMGALAGDEMTNFDMDDLYGVVLSSSLNSLDLRASYFSAKLSLSNSAIDTLVTSLTKSGLNNVANDYQFKNEPSHFYGIGFSYDVKNFFIIGEYTIIDSSPLLNKINGRYLSSGYRIGKITPYITIARADFSGLSPETRITDQTLQKGANSVAKSFNIGQKSYTLGLKYDLTKNLNLKAHYQKIDVDDNHLTIFKRENQNTDDLDIFSLTFNYVF